MNVAMQQRESSLAYCAANRPTERSSNCDDLMFFSGMRSSMPQDLFDSWLLDRRVYVESQGWKYGDDFDRYDENPNTRHVLATRRGVVMGGLRLTPVRNLQESLSWEMLTPAMREEALDAIELTSRRQMWDLTRLIPTQRTHLAPQQQLNLLYELFGLAASSTLELAAGGPRWIFATTGAFFRVAMRQGLSFNEISRSVGGCLSQQVVLCSVQPLQAIEHLMSRAVEFPHAAAGMLRGLRQDQEWALVP